MSQKSLTIEVALGDRLNALERVLETIRSESLGVLGFRPGRSPRTGLRTAFFRVVTENLCPLLERLDRAGFPVIRIRP
jgi:hypothetical protein